MTAPSRLNGAPIPASATCAPIADGEIPATGPDDTNAPVGQAPAREAMARLLTELRGTETRAQVAKRLRVVRQIVGHLESGWTVEGVPYKVDGKSLTEPDPNRPGRTRVVYARWRWVIANPSLARLEEIAAVYGVTLDITARRIEPP